MSVHRNKGFTIIEVVLVLAIAGLIFVMVFVALPALQRNQRNERRKEDMGRVVTAITNWQAGGVNNRFTGTNSGCSPTASSFNASSLSCRIIRYYLNDNISETNPSTAYSRDEFKDPSGNVYKLYLQNNSQDTDGTTETIKNLAKMSGATFGKFGSYVVVVTFGAKCNSANTDTGGIEKVSGTNYFAVRYRLEGDESATPFCRDNSE